MPIPIAGLMVIVTTTSTVPTLTCLDAIATTVTKVICVKSETSVYWTDLVLKLIALTVIFVLLLTMKVLLLPTTNVVVDWVMKAKIVRSRLATCLPPSINVISITLIFQLVVLMNLPWKLLANVLIVTFHLRQLTIAPFGVLNVKKI